MPHPRFYLLAGLVSALFSQAGFAAEGWGLCRIPSFDFIEVESLEANETLIEARSIVSEDSEIITLFGDASLRRDQQKINADNVQLDKSTEIIKASGDVVFSSPEYRLQSPSVEIDNRNDRAVFEQPRFELYGNHASGHAEKIVKLDPYRSEFSGLTYTSCDPDDRDWHLRAAEFEIDYESGRGSATHTRLYFQEVPILYLPYFQFPIDDRRMSGILAPVVGYDDSNGSTVIQPVYWNIAPNYDMTITPTAYGKRGLQLNTENRYLFENHRGQFDFSHLDDDIDDDTRWFKQWQHKTSFAYDVSGDLSLAEVSDADFFTDFGTVSPENNDVSHLERHVNFVRDGDIWTTRLLWQDYQTIDDTTAAEDRPYSRLPSLVLDAAPEPWIENVYTPLHFEWSSFDRDDSVDGERSNLVSSIKWDASQSWYFFQPELQLAFTDYQLEDNPGDDSISRGLPTLSVDSGLIFERLAGASDQWQQTIEPRLFFLHTPYENQDDIPDFDTSLNAHTYSNLFENNRFTGADRIGDANQVTFGLASRILDNESGSELMHARIGQIYYFRDRRVSLDGVREDESKSDMISELDIWPSAHLKISARVVYDQEQSELDDQDYSLSYLNSGFVANLGYYFIDEELEQALVSVVYPVNQRWTLVAKYQRSLLFDQTVENLLGLNYESCCWGLKILAGQTGDDTEEFDDTDASIYFEFTFKGLGQAGQDIDTKLSSSIPGYTPGF